MSSNVNVKNQFTILSFNVLAQAWIDKVLRRSVDNKSYLKRDYRIKKNIEVIKTINPDFVLLQEVTPYVLKKYKSIMSDYDSCFVEMFWQPYREHHAVNGNAVMWKKQLIDSFECVEYVIDKKRGINGIAVIGKLKQSNTHIIVSSIHLEYGNVLLASKQLNTALNFINKLHNNVSIKDSRECITIVGGDFNMNTNRLFVKDVLKDQKFIEISSSEYRTHPFEDTGEDSAISHILLRSSIAKKHSCCNPIRLSISDTLKNFGSDHYPLTASIKISL